MDSAPGPCQIEAVMWAVVPVKDLGAAKERLAGVLAPVERQALFRAMVEDVFAALAAARGLETVAVVTRDVWAEALAARYGARVMPEPANRGHTAAVNHAIAELIANGVRTMLTVPGDVPLATAAEIEALITAHGTAPAMTIAPAADRQGSNAVLLTPPGAVPLRFGPDSFYPHLEAARACGIEPTVVELAGLARDVDTPEDLAAFLAVPSATRTYAYLAASGIAARLGCHPRLERAAS